MKELPARSVQDYIDETPRWADDTVVASVPLTSMQWRIWGLATAGKFFEGQVVFLTGVALPLMTFEFNLGPSEKGLVGAAILFGILLGATALGGLADVWGRKKMFIGEMILFTLCLVAVAVSPNFTWVVLSLLGMGIALGCDYPTAHLMISESIPSRVRGKLVLSAFAFQAVGALVGTLVGYFILSHRESVTDWRLMYATAIVPAVAVVIGRFFITESAHWHVSQGNTDLAEREVKELLERTPAYPKTVLLSREIEPSLKQPRANLLSLFANPKIRQATIFASVPWFLQDLGTYGIGIFTPTILDASIGATQHPDLKNLSSIIYDDMMGAKGAAVIDLLLIVGIIAAIFLADRVGRVKLQMIGFIGCAVGLFIASWSVCCTGTAKLLCIFAGFMIFNFMTNMGPNAMTYLIAGEVFPTRVRGLGAGFAASFAKIGAVLTAYLFPVLLKDIGTAILLYILVGTSLLGCWVTSRYGIETKGINLETNE